MNLTFALLAAVIFATGLSAPIVWAMIKIGPVDRPNARSSHTQPVPKGGGLGPVVVFLGTMTAVVISSGWDGLALLGLGFLVVPTVALLDDIYDLRITIKLAAQVIGAGLVVASGLTVSHLGPLPLGPFGPVLTVCWIVYVTNAVNFMDGLNGLVAGTSAIAAIALVTSTAAMTKFPAAILAGSLLGFLPFNFPRARIFLGDVGSQFCGFTLAVFAVIEVGSETQTGLIVPLALMALLVDVAVTLVRRFAAGVRVTQAHRSHCYQLLHRTGVPAPWVTAAVWAMAAWGAACASLPWAAAIPLALTPPAAWTAWTWRRAGARLETW